MDARQHHLTRWIFLRLLAAVHAVAFISYWVQIHGLVGEAGVVPAADTLEAARQYFEQRGELRWWHMPTLAWWLGADDGALSLMCGGGVALSALLAVGVWPRATLAGLWLLYLSLFSVSDPFLGFQWDILLLEVTFAAVLYAPGGFFPRPDPDHRSSERPPSKAAIWLLRLILFKVMFSSGVVKLTSGDPSWRDLTAMTYHYWTQPLPHGVAWYAHNVPLWVHRLTGELMFLTELVVPFLVFFNPRCWRLAVWLGAAAFVVAFADVHTSVWAAVSLVLLALFLDDRVLGQLWQGAPTTRRMGAFWLVLGLMVGIAATGNYGFFQLLVATLCVTLLDDEVLRRVLPGRLADRWGKLDQRPTPRSLERVVVALCVAALVGLNLLQGLSLVGRETLREAVQAVEAGSATHEQHLLAWLLARRGEVLGEVRQLAIANGYGLFATMTRQRDELIVEGSRDGETWTPYRFKYKPDVPTDAPPLVGVHMPRLDWQMWFAALSPRCDPRGRTRWTLAFVQRLLSGSEPVEDLLAEVPFDTPPQAIRIRRAAYTFTDAETREETGRVWNVEPKGVWCPPLTLEAFRR